MPISLLQGYWVLATWVQDALRTGTSGRRYGTIGHEIRSSTLGEVVDRKDVSEGKTSVRTARNGRMDDPHSDSVVFHL